MASTHLIKLRKRAQQIATFKNENLDDLLEKFFEDYIQDNFDAVLSELSKMKKRSDVKGGVTETKEGFSPQETAHQTTENGEQ